MMNPSDALDELVMAAKKSFAGAATPADLENAKAFFLGKSGRVTDLMKGLASLSVEEKKSRGAAVNLTKQAIEAALNERRQALADAELQAQLKAESLDVSLPGRQSGAGGLHPVSLTLERIEAIFGSMGFDVAQGPEIETDWFNFTALNTPEDHPARSMHDTFYVEGGTEAAPNLLRTHTSPVQIRTMMSQKPPIRIIAPGRVYRSDSDATHTPMFHQIEGLVIDKGITLAHLRWTLETFIKAFFEVDDVVLRFRPSYFPFTEPSVEVDVGYNSKTGKPAGAGQVDKWLEVLGSGMVHPRVIEACGLDPNEWQGFAFGTGVDRLAMLKYGLTDLRAFFDGDIKWLKHNGFSAFDLPSISAGAVS